MEHHRAYQLLPKFILFKLPHPKYCHLNLEAFKIFSCNTLHALSIIKYFLFSHVFEYYPNLCQRVLKLLKIISVLFSSNSLAFLHLHLLIFSNFEFLLNQEVRNRRVRYRARQRRLELVDPR